VRTPPAAASWLADHARPILLQYFTPDCCIESTALALDFLRARGIACRELSVQVMIFNKPGWRLYQSGSHVNDSPTDKALWDTMGGWSIGIGFPHGAPKPNKFQGHLVALIEGGWLLDLSIEQASRPARGMAITAPLLAPCEVSALAAGLQVYDRSDGTVLVYGISDTIWRNVYKGARPWREKKQRREILAAVEAACDVEAACRK
jgi:hypothetical protein